MQDVREFHEKHGFDVGVSLIPDLPESAEREGDGVLATAAGVFAAIGKQLENGTTHPGVHNKPGVTHDCRLMRVHLIAEELAELCVALLAQDKVQVLDALGDLLYVIVGTAVAFDLPLAEAFDEIQRSNMTKAVGAGGDKDVRCRVKGESYEAPDLARVLADYKTSKGQGNA